MFLTPAFAPVRPDYLSERFLRISRHLGLPRIRFHDLQHTYATIALASGVPIHVVSERLGHMNSSVTLSVYSHVMPGMQADAAQSIADYVTGSHLGERASDSAARLAQNTRHGPWQHHLQQHK